LPENVQGQEILHISQNGRVHHTCNVMRLYPCVHIRFNA